MHSPTNSLSLSLHYPLLAGCLLLETEARFAAHLQTLPEAMIVARVMEDLRQMFGPAIPGCGALTPEA
jgi:hypothetical protein